MADIYQARPSISDAFHQLKNKSSQWNSIGGGLDVSWNDRESLRKDSSRSDNERLESIIAKWRESECSEVSWNHLIEVLKDLKFRDIIRDIETFLKTNDAIRKYSPKGQSKPDKKVYQERPVVENEHFESLKSRSGRHHNLILGVPSNEDLVLYSEEINRGRTLFNTTSYTFSYKCKMGEEITAVFAYDCWGDDTGGEPMLEDGGVGQDRVEVSVTSQFSRGFHFNFFVYGTKSN